MVGEGVAGVGLARAAHPDQVGASIRPRPTPARTFRHWAARPRRSLRPRNPAAGLGWVLTRVTLAAEPGESDVEVEEDVVGREFSRRRDMTALATVAASALRRGKSRRRGGPAGSGACHGCCLGRGRRGGPRGSGGVPGAGERWPGSRRRGAAPVAAGVRQPARAAGGPPRPGCCSPRAGHPAQPGARPGRGPVRAASRPGGPAGGGRCAAAAGSGRPRGRAAAAGTAARG